MRRFDTLVFVGFVLGLAYSIATRDDRGLVYSVGLLCGWLGAREA